MIVQHYIRPEWRKAKVFKPDQYNDLLSFIDLHKSRGTLLSVRHADCAGSARINVHYSENRYSLHGEKYK